jgi:hypothetical protein
LRQFKGYGYCHDSKQHAAINLLCVTPRGPTWLGTYPAFPLQEYDSFFSKTAQGPDKNQAPKCHDGDDHPQQSVCGVLFMALQVYQSTGSHTTLKFAGCRSKHEHTLLSHFTLGDS